MHLKIYELYFPCKKLITYDGSNVITKQNKIVAYFDKYLLDQ